MKKRTLFIWMLTMLLCVATLPATAQDTLNKKAANDSVPANADKTAKTSKDKKASAKGGKDKKEVGEVLKALSRVHTLSGRLNKKAEYFLYLQSASWCGPCCNEMPGIVKEYKKMKKANVEIMLFGHDRTADDAKAFVKRFGMKFPVTLDHQKGKLKVPGFIKAGGIPHLTIVDSNGKVLANGHPGSLIPRWESIINEDRKAKKNAEQEDSQDAGEEESED